MGRRVCWSVTSLFFSFLLVSLGASSTMSIESLDSTIRDSALDVSAQAQMTVAYEVPLPSNLSGIRASVESIRSIDLWSRGAQLSYVVIPPSTTTVPFARTLVIVYQDLANKSSSYFSVPGYSLIAPVVGYRAYDASSSSSAGIRELELRVLGDPISITFPEVALPTGPNSTGLKSTVKCARLGPQGSVQLSSMSSENACSARRTGHFTVVVPAAVPGTPPALARGWRVWVIACGSGVVGLVLVGLVGMGILWLKRNKKLKAMERKAEEGEGLGTLWAGRSKMPSAAMSRTGPVIEEGTAP